MQKEITSPEARAKLIELLQQSPQLRELDPVHIAEFGARAKIFTYHNGDTVLQQDEPTTGFYFIVQGQLKIVRTVSPKKSEDTEPSEAEQSTATVEPIAKVLNYMSAGEYLGELSLRRHAKTGIYMRRYATAEVIVDSIVAAYTLDDWDWLLHIYPQFEKICEEIEKGYEEHKKIRFEGIQPDEVGILNINRHPLVFFGQLSPAIGLVLVGLILVNLLGDFHIGTLYFGSVTLWLLGIVSVLSIIYEFAEWTNDDFIISSRRVVHIERYVIGGGYRNVVPLTQILGVEVNSPNFFTRAMGYTNVIIKAAGVAHVTFDGVYDGEQVKGLILREVRKAKERSKAADISAIKTAVHKQILSREVAVEPLKTPKAPEQKKRIPIDLKRIFGFILPRVYQKKPDGTIIWRRHHIIWLREIWQPAVVWLLTTYLMFAALVGMKPFFESFPDFALGLVLPWLIVGFWFAYQHDNWRKISYEVTKTKIIQRNRPVLQLRGEDVNETTFDNVQNINFNIPNFLARLLRLGDVEIKTASVGDPFVFRNLYYPKVVQQQIFQYWVQFRDDQKQKERTSEEERFTRWLAEYHQQAQDMR